mgnify:CR=1 FL=1
MEKIEIKKENILAAYATAREAGADSTMKVLEQLFGAETFKPRDITERIKTFDDALDELGECHPMVVQYNDIFDSYLDGASKITSGDLLAYLKLRIICAALNEGWEPQFTEDEYRFYPYLWLYTKDEIDRMSEDERKDIVLFGGAAGHGAYAGFASALTAAPIGSRLCLKSDTLAVYCGRQFADLWADFYLIRKKVGTTDQNDR